MFSKILQSSTALAAIISIAAAQKQTIIPDDMKAGFRSGKEVQVSFTNEAVNGFKDGTLFEKDGTNEHSARK